MDCIGLILSGSYVGAGVIDRRKEGCVVSKADFNPSSTSEPPGKHLKTFPGSTPTTESVPRWYPSVYIFRKL